jgi:hypothetical protein
MAAPDVPSTQTTYGCSLPANLSAASRFSSKLWKIVPSLELRNDSHKGRIRDSSRADLQILIFSFSSTLGF